MVARALLARRVIAYAAAMLITAVFVGASVVLFLNDRVEAGAMMLMAAIVAAIWTSFGAFTVD